MLILTKVLSSSVCKQFVETQTSDKNDNLLLPTDTRMEL